ncbi:MAG: hypothetical protein IJW73_07225 [Candidatus Gastranaerophilales bacterium]|nr:hypothetical protein [Candidatus Gastranaerophilales bacterium]
MNIPKIASSAANKVKKISTKATEYVQKHPKLSKAIDKFEPNGGDNTFFGLATIMLAFVLAPRIKTALTRNPDNKEETKDEIQEILFRDIQTILIMLFGLKSLNSVVANLSTKISGIPVVDVPYKKLFDKNVEGFKNKVIDVAKHPIDKLKKIGSNILATLNPIGGSSSLNGKQINSLYSNYQSSDEVKKLLKTIPERGGDTEAVFAKIKNSITSHLEEIISKAKNSSVINPETGLYPEKIEAEVEPIQKTLDWFKELTLDKFMDDEPLRADAEEEIKKFFAKDDNALAKSAKRVNDWLRMLALGIEVSYLGFGLPALNQRRLKKKYLGEKPIGTQNGDTFSPINDRHIKAQEIKLYSSFMK